MDWQTELDFAIHLNDVTKLKQAISLITSGGIDFKNRLILNQTFFKMCEKKTCSLALFRVFTEACGDIVNSRDSRGNTPLSLCPKEDIAQFLLDSGAVVNRVNEDNKAPLQLAIEQQRTSIAKLLIKHGARCQIGDLTCAAVWCQDVSLIEMLVNIGSDVNERNLCGYTPLMASVRNDEPKIVEFLIKSGADVNAVAENKWKHTVLMEAVIPNPANVFRLEENLQYNRFRALRERNMSVALISLLLKAGANVNACDALGRTALMLCESTTIAELLIKNGADVNHTIRGENNRQLSVLSHMLSQSESMSQLLVRYGARVDADDLVRLMSSSEYTASSRLSQIFLNLFNHLLYCGANVNARNRNGLTPLMLCKDKTLAEKLIEKGADVNATCIINSTEMSVFSLSMEHGCMEMVVFLSSHGAVVQPEDLFVALRSGCDDKTLAALISSCPRKDEFINMRDTDGKTPLMICRCRTVDSILMLLELGADVNARINNGRTDNITVLMDRMTVRNMKDVSIVQALLEAGADVNAVSTSGATAMSLLLATYCLQDNRAAKSCFELLIKHGAKITGEFSEVFAKCIKHAQHDMVELFVTNGASPVSLCPSSSYHSACYLALLERDVELARYFREINFLTPSDVSQMPKILKLKTYLGEEVDFFVDEMLHNPLSLFRLSFIVVSALLGPAPGREERVQGLGIPPSLQRKLLFRDLSVKLT